MSNKQPQQQPTTSLRVLNQSFIDAAIAYKYDVWMRAAQRFDVVATELGKMGILNTSSLRGQQLQSELKGLTKILEDTQPS